MIIVSIYVIYRYLCLNLLFPEGSMVFGTKMPITSPDDCDITLTALQLVFLLQLHTLLTTDFQIDFQILPVHRKFGKVFVGFQPLCFPCVWVCPKIYVPHECPTKMDHFFRAFWGVVLCLCNGRVFLHLRRLDVELARENPKYLQSRWGPVGRKKGRESCVAEV